MAHQYCTAESLHALKIDTIKEVVIYAYSVRLNQSIFHLPYMSHSFALFIFTKELSRLKRVCDSKTKQKKTKKDQVVYLLCLASVPQGRSWTACL